MFQLGKQGLFKRKSAAYLENHGWYEREHFAITPAWLEF
jgi:hypothetical protein